MDTIESKFNIFETQCNQKIDEVTTKLHIKLHVLTSAFQEKTDSLTTRIVNLECEKSALISQLPKPS